MGQIGGRLVTVVTDPDPFHHLEEQMVDGWYRAAIQWYRAAVQWYSLEPPTHGTWRNPGGVTSAR
eukprot:1176198-Prorocentrum_minimum.AAC.1